MLTPFCRGSAQLRAEIRHCGWLHAEFIGCGWLHTQFIGCGCLRLAIGWRGCGLEAEAAAGWLHAEFIGYGWLYGASGPGCVQPRSQTEPGCSVAPSQTLLSPGARQLRSPEPDCAEPWCQAAQIPGAGLRGALGPGSSDPRSRTARSLGAAATYTKKYDALFSSTYYP